MADIELVIKIPEGLKKDFESEQWTALSCMEMKDALMKGTPLPKRHGRIMDVDRVIKKMGEREERLKDDRSMYETSCVETALNMFGETIIEADKEQEDNGFFDEIMDDSEDGEVYEKIKEIIAKVKEQEE